MHVYVDLPEEMDAAEWGEWHAEDRVPDFAPYGLNKLARHGVRPEFSKPLRPGPVQTLAGKIRGRINDADVVSVALTAARAERRRADAVLCWDERNGVPAALVPGGPPVVSGAMWLADPAALHPFTRAMTARAVPRMAALFHVCSPMLGIVEKAWNLRPGTVRRIPMGVDDSFYSPEPRRPDEPSNIVFSVGDDRRRDHHALIRAVDRVARRGTSVRLELGTTTGVEVPEHLGVVHRRRLGSGVRDMYRRSAVVAVAVQPGAGGSGLTVLTESMASGRPLVITANPGIEEYVQDGVTGLLVPPGDDEAFADAIASLLTDPAGAEAMGKEARRVVEEQFTTHHTAAALADVLKSIR